MFWLMKSLERTNGFEMRIENNYVNVIEMNIAMDGKRNLQTKLEHPQTWVYNFPILPGNYDVTTMG